MSRYSTLVVLWNPAGSDPVHWKPADIDPDSLIVVQIGKTLQFEFMVQVKQLVKQKIRMPPLLFDLFDLYHELELQTKEV